MSGHSKWANIKHKKGKADAERGKAFTKIGREIAMAVREGGGDYRYFRKLHQGKPLYVVTYGHFATPAAAKSAVTGLPARLQAGKPWPRTFASIQQEIRQAGR